MDTYGFQGLLRILEKGEAGRMKGVVGIIPARYNSTRLPGKPLLDIGGKTMIQWVAERAKKSSKLSNIIVATDDKRIFDCVRDFGCDAVMTPVEISSGTDRVAFVAETLDINLVVSLQGDEPFIEPQEIDLVVEILQKDSDSVMGTLVKRLTSVDELLSPNTAKVVVDENRNALYFSRSPVPFFRDKDNHNEWLQGQLYYKHIGIYSFRKDFLLKFSGWEPTPLEKTEKLEQLRVLEKGYRIKVAVTNSNSMCIDTQEDLQRARQYVEKIKY